MGLQGKGENWSGNWFDKYDAKIREYFSKYDEMQEFIVKQVLISKKHRNVIDIGIGTGDFAYRILTKDPNIRVIGLDLDKNMLNKARERLKCFAPRIILKKADIREIKNYHDIDIVVSTLTVHHLFAKEKRSLFKMIYQILNPDGIFIIADIMKPDDDKIQMDYDDETDFPDKVSSHREWLRDIGFVITDYWNAQDIHVIVSKKHE